jgi:hypothetical protein
MAADLPGGTISSTLTFDMTMIMMKEAVLQLMELVDNGMKDRR